MASRHHHQPILLFKHSFSGKFTLRVPNLSALSHLQALKMRFTLFVVLSLAAAAQEAMAATVRRPTTITMTAI